MGIVNYELDGNVAIISLNRPEAMNTFNPDMYREFNEATRRFRDDPDAWVAIITAKGEKAFSAGVDINAIDELARGVDDIETVAQQLEIELEGEYFCDKPIVAAIQGYCIGEGLSLVLGCDLRIASEDAKFALPEGKIGIPTINAAMHGARVMGGANALELLLLGEHRDASWAFRTGLVNRVVPKEELFSFALGWAKRIASLSPLANCLTKEMALKSFSRSFCENAEIGIRKRDKLLKGNDAEEGRRAFIEKRPPCFTGT